MAEGSGEQIDAFLLMLEKRAPERSVILKIDVKDVSEDKTVNRDCESVSGDSSK